MNVTGKTISVSYHGTHYVLCNQRCREWTHPYAWEGKGTLTDSGCSVFSIANAACFLGGERVIPEELADFSCRNGGRGDMCGFQTAYALFWVSLTTVRDFNLLHRILPQS